MTQHFAICTFRATGPIKSFSELQASNIHNARTKPIPHGIADRPAPKHLMGSGDLVADVKRKLRVHHIDPDNLRKNGVIAYEAVMTASPAFFQQGDEDEQARRLKDWTNGQVQFAWGRYGDRVASMVLHLDEETPHIHLVVVPLLLVDDQRRRERSHQWSLVGATISGPGKFDELQDDYADAMSRFGLVRGERGSGQKNEPPGMFMKRLAAEREAAEEHERVALESQAEAERQRQFWVQMQRLAKADADCAAAAIAEARATEQRAKRQREDAEKQAAANIAEADRLENYRMSLKANADTLVEGWEKLDAERAEFDEERSDQRQVVAEAVKSLEEANAVKAALSRTLATARTFVSAAKTLRNEDLTPAARSALQAVLGLKREAEAIRPPANDPSEATQAASMRCSSRLALSGVDLC